uniref:Putative metalloprotease n=1 Tax=Ixodes ricinus TaxID=34613 RepID=A0A0K8REN5_IXORI
MTPAINVSYIGSRKLTDEEERNILGIKGNDTDVVVKGTDAIKALMDLIVSNNDLVGSNNVFLVLTGYNITEEETKNEANANTLSFSDTSSSEESGKLDGSDDLKITSRSASRSNDFSNVGGVSQFGTICFTPAAIVQDFGSNFSGVANAAAQVANILGHVYNGTIPRRQCGDYDYALGGFHGDECNKIKELPRQESNDEYECLKDSVKAIGSKWMTPSMFYSHYRRDWPQCRTSYFNSVECTKPSKSTYQYSECRVSCCPKYKYIFLNPTINDIPAPDGENCDAHKICVGGKCVQNTTSVEGK